MEPERWQKIEALYNSALSLGAKERVSWLAQECAGDDGIRLDVLSLLESADTADSFLEAPALSFGLTVLGLERQSLVGSSIGRYKILETLGHGGMGEVYLAQDSRLVRRVALKLLPGSITDDRERVRRFQQEAQAASAISHPNVAHVYEIGESDGRHYITMEYVKGRTLRQLLRQKSLDTDKALGIAIQVATALSAAHRAGVIHRDIKPENIIMADDGYVKVLDFGLAKLIEKPAADPETEAQLLTSLHTEPELFMGTSHYMSPEQVRRRPVDQRTDLWSLGVVSYEMLTQHRPFQGKSFSEVIVAILEDEPELRWVEQFNPSPAVQAFLGKALKKRPEDRYQTADEMLTDLRQVQQDGRLEVTSLRDNESEYKSKVYPNAARADREPSATVADPIRPKTLSQRLDTVVDDRVSRRSVLALTRNLLAGRSLQLALAMLLVSSVVGGLMLLRKHPTTLVARNINLRFDRLNLSGNIDDITLSPDGKYVASIIPEGGKHTIHISELTTGSDLRIVPPSERSYSGLSFPPDGTYVYYLENRTETGTLYRVSKFGGGPHKVLDNVNTAITFSPDGARMAFIRVTSQTEPGNLSIAQVDGTGERVLTSRTRDGADPFFYQDMKGPGPAWSPDGRLLACASREKPPGTLSNLEVIDVDTGSSRLLNVTPWSAISRFAWLADGSGLVIAAKKSPTSPWQLARVSYPGGNIQQITTDPNNYTRLSSTADSSAFLTLNVEDDSNIWMVALGDRERFSPRTVSQKKGVSEVLWTSGGKLLYVLYDGVNSNLWRQDENGTNAEQLTFESNTNFRPVVTPDQRHIVFVSERAGAANIWRMDAEGAQLKQLTSGPYEDQPAVTPDGNWVVYRTGGEVRKVSIEGGGSSKLFGKGSLNPVVSPDGRWLGLFTKDQIDSKEWYLEVIDFRTLAAVKRFELPVATDPFLSLRWTLQSDGLTYISNADGSSNLWLQPLNGSAPRRLTDFKDAEIQSFSWSADGKQIACVRRAKTYIPFRVSLF